MDVSPRDRAIFCARTLARRLRRQRVKELGVTTASALNYRTQTFRKSLAAHWQLCESLGAHVPLFGDAIFAASLLHFPSDEISSLRETKDLGNWARHAPPPGVTSLPPAPVAPSVSDVEAFRQVLFWPQDGCSVTDGDVSLDGGTFILEESDVLERAIPLADLVSHCETAACGLLSP